jgi:NitT/TauT family transport system substrate-binding protein
MNIRVIPKFFFVLFSIAAIASSCARAEDNKTKMLKISYANTYAASVQLIIKEKNYLRSYTPKGVEVTFENIEGAANIRDAIVTGNIDIASNSGGTVISCVENALPIKVLSAAACQPMKVYTVNPKINSVQDLKNAERITINAISSNSHYALMMMCKDLFGDPALLNSKLSVLSLEDTITALANNGEVDCFAGYFPYTAKFEAIPEARLVVDLTPYVKQYGIGSYFMANEDYYDANPEIIEAFYKAQKDAVDFMINKPEDAAEILNKYYNVDKMDIENVIKELPPSVEITGYDDMAELLYESEIIDHAPKKFSELPNYADIPKAP